MFEFIARTANDLLKNEYDLISAKTIYLQPGKSTLVKLKQVKQLQEGLRGETLALASAQEREAGRRTRPETA